MLICIFDNLSFIFPLHYIAVFLTHPVAGQNCSRYENTTGELWFTDDPTTLTSRTNWTPKKLDALLNRSQCCKCLLYGNSRIFLFLFFDCICCVLFRLVFVKSLLTSLLHFNMTVVFSIDKC